MEVSISHTVGSQKSITIENKKEHFGFGDVKINKTFIDPPHILEVIFEINYQFEIIDPLRFNIKAGVNSSVISIDSKSGIDNN